jgi:hypothetical protein
MVENGKIICGYYRQNFQKKIQQLKNEIELRKMQK